MFAAVLTADLACPRNSDGANGYDGEKVDQDQVLELPSVSQPQATTTDSSATPDSAAIGSSTTPPDCTAHPDDGSASAGANGARGCSRPNSQAQQASIDATQHASAQGTDTLDSSLGTLQDYEQQQTVSEGLGLAGVYQMPLAVVGVPLLPYYLSGTTVVRAPSRSPVFVPSLRRPVTPALLAKRPPAASHPLPRTIGGFTGFPRTGGFRNMGRFRGR